MLRSDGDKKAYKESSQWAIRQNKDVISQLRQENKMLRAKLSKKMMVYNNCGALYDSLSMHHRRQMTT